MQKIIGVTELQRRFRSVFDEVVRKRTSVVLTRGSRPEAVLIPYQEYLRFQEIQESEVLARFDQVWDRLAELNAAYSDEEIAADIEKARRE
ncbi:MAG TPA: type II toxin-antitoxin system Phd/YefM family antitoxin [Anaerolineales bacterium]|jgi:prevent-host-death family protein|nr:type II toxin-antitoxin system Phd/YefM family antitoxin [Anaerolineales bacterium]